MASDLGLKVAMYCDSVLSIGGAYAHARDAGDRIDAARLDVPVSALPQFERFLNRVYAGGLEAVTTGAYVAAPVLAVQGAMTNSSDHLAAAFYALTMGCAYRLLACAAEEYRAHTMNMQADQ